MSNVQPSPTSTRPPPTWIMNEALNLMTSTSLTSPLRASRNEEAPITTPPTLRSMSVVLSRISPEALILISDAMSTSIATASRRVMPLWPSV